MYLRVLLVLLLLVAPNLFAARAESAPGALDGSFATAGELIAPIGSADDEAFAVAIDGLGRIVVAGSGSNGTDLDFAVARFTATGAADPSFGSGGVVATAIGPSTDAARAIAIDGSGRILVAGSSADGLGHTTFALARYDGTGTLDPLFGTGGVVTTAFGSGDAEARAMVIDGSARIVLAGTATSAGDTDFALARYDGAGALDASFGTGGIVTTAFGPSSDDEANAVVVDGNDRIVVAGWSDVAAAGNRDFALARFDALGVLDGAFGTGGLVTLAPDTGDDELRAVAIDSGTRIVAAGVSHRAGTGDDAAVARFADGGDPDATFGSGGVAFSARSGNDSANALALEPSGRIVVAGATTHDFELAAFTAGGVLDTDFGTTGLVTTSFDTGIDTARAAVLDASGRIVVAGSSDTGSDLDVAVARYLDGCGDGELDAGEQCDDGNTASGDCCSPTCAFEAAGSICRAAADVCDVAETCDGSSTTCPADALRPASFTCRSAAGECDVTESCSGSSAACPADVVKSNGIACTDDGNACTNDVCDGASAGCTHPAGHAGLTCRAAADVCDVAETCNGSSTTCPADAFRPSSFACRSAAGECDVAETCTGTSAACPANGFTSAGTACTDDGNVCTADTCNGAGSCTHPAGNAGTLCRAAADVCDLAETCNGSSTSCPTNAFRPSTFTCRSASGECDIAESCTGIGPSCPVNVFKPFDAACTADSNPCTSDRCDGSGTCTHPPANAGTVCRASAGACDVAETCDGSSVVCPADSGTPDSDGDAQCDAQDACTNAGHGQDFKPLPKPKLALQRINENLNPGDDQLKFQGVFDLAAGESFASFDPSLTGVRVLLLNQFGGTELDVALPGGTYHGAGTRGWKANGLRTRWKYSDKTTDGMLTTIYGGVYEVQVSDRDRRTPREVQVKVAARFGTYPVVTFDSPVRMIVVLGGQTAAIEGMCGETAFVAADCAFNNLGTSLSCRM